MRAVRLVVGSSMSVSVHISMRAILSRCVYLRLCAYRFCDKNNNLNECVCVYLCAAVLAEDLVSCGFFLGIVLIIITECAFPS